MTMPQPPMAPGQIPSPTPGVLPSEPAPMPPPAPPGNVLPPVGAPPPPAMPAPKPQRLPETITPDMEINRRPDPAKIKNPFERTAAMIVEAAEDSAKRLASHLSEAAADYREADPQTVHEMMQFSRYGADAPRVFWETHDRILNEAVAANDPDPYAAAERGALDEVYPYRAQIALLDVLDPEEKVKRAEMLMEISNRQTSRGSTPESLPFITGPAGRPAEPEEPPEPSSNGRTNGRAYP